MILVEDGDNFFTIADFFYNEKERYIKMFYRDGKTRLIQNVRCTFVVPDGILRITINRGNAYEKT